MLFQGTLVALGITLYPHRSPMSVFAVITDSNGILGKQVLHTVVRLINLSKEICSLLGRQARDAAVLRRVAYAHTSKAARLTPAG